MYKNLILLLFISISSLSCFLQNPTPNSNVVTGLFTGIKLYWAKDSNNLNDSVYGSLEEQNHPVGATLDSKKTGNFSVNVPSVAFKQTITPITISLYRRPILNPYQEIKISEITISKNQADKIVSFSTLFQGPENPPVAGKIMLDTGDIIYSVASRLYNNVPYSSKIPSINEGLFSVSYTYQDAKLLTDNIQIYLSNSGDHSVHSITEDAIVTSARDSRSYTYPKISNDIGFNVNYMVNLKRNQANGLWTRISTILPGKAGNYTDAEVITDGDNEDRGDLLYFVVSAVVNGKSIVYVSPFKIKLT